MDFLKFSDISAKQLRELLALCVKLKAQAAEGKLPELLKNKTLLMFFEKNSTRTRISFEVAMTQLGGHAIFLESSASQFARGESYSDTGKIAGGMADLVMARVHSHLSLQQLADGSPAPAINGLSDLEHPCQALADLLTLQELGKLSPGSKVAYVGDCRNNVANSLICALSMAGVKLSLAGPREFSPLPEYVKMSAKLGVQAQYFEDPVHAVKGADAVYTDTWISMGDEDEGAKRLRVFEGYGVGRKMMSLAARDAVFMHCLPAHRGQEASTGVIDGPQSVVFSQAQNRLHAQRGLLVWLSKQG